MEHEDPSPREVVDRLRRVNRILRRRFEHDLRGAGLSFAQFEIMALLFDRPNRHAGELARRLLITPQSVASLVGKLEAAGLIERLDPDGRIVGLRLTDAGSRRARFCVGALRPTMEAIASVPPEVRRCLTDDLHETETALRPPPPPWWLDSGRASR